MLLLEPDASFADAIGAYRAEFVTEGGSMDGCGSLRRLSDPMEWLRHTQVMRKEETTPPGLVPATLFLYVREDDRKIVGMIQIRHRFNDFLEKYAGHIGYSVAPSERRKGYADAMLKAALPYCREIGLNRVLIACLTDNEGSRKTILKNGGVYESTVFEPKEGVYLERYWITLT